MSHRESRPNDLAPRDRPRRQAPSPTWGCRSLQARGQSFASTPARSRRRATRRARRRRAALRLPWHHAAQGVPCRPKAGLRTLPFGFPAGLVRDRAHQPGRAAIRSRCRPSGRQRERAPQGAGLRGQRRLLRPGAPARGDLRDRPAAPTARRSSSRASRSCPTEGFSIHPVAVRRRRAGVPDPPAVFDRIRAITPTAGGRGAPATHPGLHRVLPRAPPHWKYLGHDTQYEGYVDIGDPGRPDAAAQDRRAPRIPTPRCSIASWTTSTMAAAATDAAASSSASPAAPPTASPGTPAATLLGDLRHRLPQRRADGRHELQPAADVGRPRALPRARPGTREPACGGGDGDQVGESWPPDEVGHIQGIGLDPRPGSGAGGRRPLSDHRRPAARPGGLPSKPGGTTGHWYDFMSYCAAAGLGDFDSWQSVQGWEETLRLLRTDCRWVFPATRGGGLPTQICPGESGFRRASRTRPRAAAPVVPGLRVQARDDGTVTINDVAPLTAPPTIAPAAARYRLVAHDASGALLADTPMAVDITHVDGSGAVILLSGQVPASHAAQVEIQRDGVVVASRTRSAHPPRVRVIAPRRQTVVGVRGMATVRWRASDADRDPLHRACRVHARQRQALQAHLGRPSRSGARDAALDAAVAFAARARARAHRGRLRRSDSAVGAVRGRGGPPALRIIAPARGQHIAADAALDAQAEAWNDAPSPITGRGLRWFDGRRRIATGAHPSITGLRPGRGLCGWSRATGRERPHAPSRSS